MEQAARQKENIKAGATEVSTVDLLKMVGSLAKDHITRVRVPALTFSFSRSVRSYWDALWDGHHLPLRFRINGEVDKEIFVGRLAFATLYIVADSIWLVGRSGFWLIKKVPWKWIDKLLLGAAVVGFIGIIWPWWVGLDPWLQVPKFEMETSSLVWLLGLPLVAVPFSVQRFRKWEGIKRVLKRRDRE